MKKYIVVTGGSGFIGSNLIRLLLIKTKLRIISIDDYSSGSKKNHVVNTRVKYYKSHTKNISEVLKKKRKKDSIGISFWGVFKNLSKFS